MTAAQALVGALGILVIVVGLAHFGPQALARESSDVRKHRRHRRGRWVYVMANGTRKDNARAPVKVGVAKDPAQRLKTFLTGRAEDLVIYYKVFVRYPFQIEAKAHRILKPYHIRREWFAVSPEDAVSAVHMVIGQPRPGLRNAVRRMMLRLRTAD